MSRQWYQRKNLRLQDHDYTKAGFYFVTVCAQGQKSIFGDIKDGNVFLNSFGDAVLQNWLDLPQYFFNVNIHNFVIMPDHFHGIIEIKNVGAGFPRSLENVPLGRIVAYFKYISTKQINEIRQTQGVQIWQRNYHDRIIRNTKEMRYIKRYIAENPRNWDGSN